MAGLPAWQGDRSGSEAPPSVLGLPLASCTYLKFRLGGGVGGRGSFEAFYLLPEISLLPVQPGQSPVLRKKANLSLSFEKRLIFLGLQNKREKNSADFTTSVILFFISLEEISTHTHCIIILLFDPKWRDILFLFHFTLGIS